MTSSLYLLIFGVGLGGEIELQDGFPYLHFLIPGLLMMGVINNSYLNTSSGLVISRLFGDLEDLKVSPLSIFDLTGAMSLASTTRAFLVSFVILFVSELFVYTDSGTFLFPVYILPFFSVLFMAGVTFGLLGMVVGLYSKSWETLNAITQFILLPLIYLGGVFFSLDRLPEFWQNIALFNPMLYYISALRYSVLGYSDIPFENCLIVISLFFILVYTLTYNVTKRVSFRHI